MNNRQGKSTELVLDEEAYSRLESYDILSAVRIEKHKRAFDQLAMYSFIEIRKSNEFQAGIRGMDVAPVPSFAQCIALFEKMLKHNELWKKILMKKASNFNLSKHRSLTADMARILMNDNYVSLVARHK